MNSKRLLAIASFIEKDDLVVDIGCDHAYLDIYLIQNRLCKKTIASDISEGAINQARINIEKYNLTNKIPTVVSNGLENIPYDINTVVISGMGTNTILEILNNPKTNNIDKFIIQSNNNLVELRCEMNKRNYKIIQEKVVLDSGKYYTIIMFKRGKERLNKITKLLGNYNSENKDYYNYLYNKNLEILKKIPKFKIKKTISILTLLKYLRIYKKMVK